jgi:hypothetical protein
MGSRDIDSSEGENKQSVKPLDDELNPGEQQIQDLNPSDVRAALGRLQEDSNLGTAGKSGSSEHFKTKPSSEEGAKIDKDGSISFDKNPLERPERGAGGGTGGKGDRLDRVKPDDSISEDSHGIGNDINKPGGGGKGKPFDINSPREVQACVARPEEGPPDVNACVVKLKPDGTEEDPAEVRPLGDPNRKGFPEKDQSRLPQGLQRGAGREPDEGTAPAMGRMQGKEPRARFEGKSLEVKPENRKQPSDEEKKRAEKIFDDLKKAFHWDRK